MPPIIFYNHNIEKISNLSKNANAVKNNVILPPLRERQSPPYNVYNKPLIKIKIIHRIILAIIICTVCLCPVAYAERTRSALSDISFNPLDIEKSYD